MAMDPFFTSAYKKPRVNHKHDEAFAIFEALPPKERDQIVSKWYDKIRANKKLTRREYSMFLRWKTKKEARRHIGQMHRQARYIKLAKRTPIVGGLDSCGWQTHKPSRRL